MTRCLHQGLHRRQKLLVKYKSISHGLKKGLNFRGVRETLVNNAFTYVAAQTWEKVGSSGSFALRED